jgi:hypothetical protein
MTELDDLRTMINQPKAQTFYVSSPATKYLEHWLLNEVQLEPDFSAYMWAAKYAKLLAESIDPEERYTVRKLKQHDGPFLQALFERLDFKTAHTRQILKYLASLKEGEVPIERRELSEAEAENAQLAKRDREGPQFTIKPQEAEIRLFQDVNCYSPVFADGLLVVVGTGQNLEVWGLGAGQQQCISTMTGHTGNVLCCMIFRSHQSQVIGRGRRSTAISSISSADSGETILSGWYVLSGSDDNKLRVWDLSCTSIFGEKCIATLEGTAYLCENFGAARVLTKHSPRPRRSCQML